MTDFSILSNTATSKIPNISYPWGLKKVPFRAEPPRTGHYREYRPPSPPGARPDANVFGGIIFIAALKRFFQFSRKPGACEKKKLI